MKMATKTKLQRTPKGQYMITIPKALIDGLGWKKLDELQWQIIDGGLFLSRDNPYYKDLTREDRLFVNKALDKILKIKR